MPNYCGNTLTISHDNPEMITRAVKAFERREFLNEFIPVPEELTNNELSSFYPPGSDKEAANLQLKQEMKAKYGYESWYDFCLNEWGTKWDVGDSQGIQTFDDNELVVYFDSAWAPPTSAYDKLMDLGFTVYATYYEPGSAFAGIYDEHGDDCYNLGDMDSVAVQQRLPQELDEAYGISESMAEYEAENQDEVTSWYKEGVEATGLEPHKVDPKLK